jgi:hypothetical protein
MNLLNLFNIIGALLLAGSVSLITYWEFESDPLEVDAIDPTFSTCVDRTFTFKRFVKTDKPIDIYVQQHWHNTDGFDDYNGIEGELVIPETDHYPLNVSTMKSMTFEKPVPINVGIGMYEYRPIATYRVNPLKIITKQLPVQRVWVKCDYTPVHKENK